MVLIFANILSVFSISLIGFAANKLKWLPVDSTKYLSMLLFNISSPCLVIYSMSQQELNSEMISSAVQTAILMILALIGATMISFIAVKMMKADSADRGVYQTLMFLTNSGFMGFPLSLAVFGQKGLFLTMIANAVFVIYTYSVGVIVLISGKDEKLSVKTAFKSVFSIPVISSVIGVLLFAFGIRLPSLLANFLDTVGAITIPLSMLIIGIQLAESKVRELLRNKHLFQTLILKLVIVPAILFGVLMWLPINTFVLCIVVFAMALPSAAVVPVISEIYGANTKLAAQAVFLTTMFSMISIPIVALLLNLYLAL